jgi:aspartyl-tRNA(Asn)/glutamyl-tRNA(Gln) amidotransferase subunit C
MPSISEDDVRHVAALARLGVSDARVRELTADLATILAHMDALRRVPTDGVAEFRHGDDRGMPLRPDVAAQTGFSPLESAPAARDGFFVVPRLSTHTDMPGSGEP